MATVYLALGSNLGNPAEYLKQAIKNLKKIGTIQKISSFYKTEPVGKINQPWFLNCVVEMTTTLTPLELLNKINNIETALGRIRSVKWGPRTIDIDILLYDNLVLETEQLTIPHHLFRERRFVLEPLAEIAPDAIDPITKKLMCELLKTIISIHKIEKI